MTNCPNCGAPVIGSRCEYCETHFPGYRPPSYYTAVDMYDKAIKKIPHNRKRLRLEEERLRVKNELVEASIKALENADRVNRLYEDAINAMRAYGRV